MIYGGIELVVSFQISYNIFFGFILSGVIKG
jgi:hypothetical protein